MDAPWLRILEKKITMFVGEGGGCTRQQIMDRYLGRKQGREKKYWEEREFPVPAVDWVGFDFPPNLLLLEGSTQGGDEDPRHFFRSEPNASLP